MRRLVYTTGNTTKYGMNRILRDLLILTVGFFAIDRFGLGGGLFEVLTVHRYSSPTASCSEMKIDSARQVSRCHHPFAGALYLPSRIRRCRDWPSWPSVGFYMITSTLRVSAFSREILNFVLSSGPTSLAGKEDVFKPKSKGPFDQSGPL